VKSHAIASIDDSPDDHFFTRIAELAEAGVDAIQLRGKSLEGRALFEVALRVRALTAGKSAFLVNGRADVAMAARADGVHLPGHGSPVAMVRALSKELILGRSCHSRAEVQIATDAGCDYVLYGPVFDTRSKPGSAAVSRADLMAAAVQSCDLYALGGISRENLHELAGTGIAGVAAITLFMRDSPVREIVEAVRAI
jgi:thiamine-phosphate diphosphorylase